MSRTILITGGAGFIGSNFIRYYLHHHPEDKVINVDKLTYCGNLENLKDLEHHPHYQFVQADICEEHAITSIMEKVDAVIHFAAESHVDNSIKEPFVFSKTNVIGTHVLLEAARKSKVQRFLHISTDEVYGSIKEGSFKETDRMNPSSPYSSSKAGAELLAKSYHTTYGLPVSIVRCSNAFGPHQYPEKVIPLFVTNLLENKKVPLYGDGLNIRDWVYVLDFCSAVDFVFNLPQCEGEIFNVPGNCSITNYDLTHQILALLGKDDSSIQPVADRLGHDRRYSVDGSKLMSKGWKSNHEFNQALKTTVEWYKNNPQWWRKLKK